MLRRRQRSGTLIGDNLSSANHENYVASEAFSGSYEIAIMGSKQRFVAQPTERAFAHD